MAKAMEPGFIISYSTPIKNSNLQVQLQLQLENPEVASAITHPSSGCTHLRLLADPLDGTLVGWLAG